MLVLDMARGWWRFREWLRSHEDQTFLNLWWRRLVVALPVVVIGNLVLRNRWHDNLVIVTLVIASSARADYDRIHNPAKMIWWGLIDRPSAEPPSGPGLRQNEN